MKKIIFIIILVFIEINVYSQNYWFKIINSPNYQNPVGDLLISNNNYFFNAIEQDNSDFYNNYYSIIFKVDDYGNFTSSQIINNNSINVLGTTEKLINGNNLAIGHYYLTNNEMFALYMIEYDEELNIIHEAIDSIDIKFGYIMNSFVGYNNEIYFHCMTSVTPFTFGSDNVYLSKISQQKEIIIDTIIEKGSYDFAPFPNNNSIIIHSRGLDNSSGNLLYQLNELDTNFNFISTPASFNPDSLGYFLSIELSEDSNYYISGMRYAGGDLFYNSFGAVKLNDNFETQYYQNFDTLPYWHFTPNHNGIDSYEDYVYTGGNFEYRGMYQSYPNYFTLTKMDTSLNIINKKYYGGDKNYLLNSIKTTPEGDVLMLGHCSDLGTDLYNIFILKVDENGLITNTNEEETIPIKNAITTPNPGKDYFQLHTGIYPSQLQIFNINGQLVLEENIQQNTTTINTQLLSSGSYVWQLIKDGEVVESDKWVKE